MKEVTVGVTGGITGGVTGAGVMVVSVLLHPININIAAEAAMINFFIISSSLNY
jgi:hypothetical protein